MNPDDRTEPLDPDDRPAMPPELQARLAEVSAEAARRGARRHRALYPRVPAGWSWRGNEYVRQHDEDLRVVPAVEDDAADADLFGPDSPVWEALDLSGTPRPEGPRPATVHLILLRRGAPLTERDVARAAAFLPPGAPSMRRDGSIASDAPDPGIAHLWAVVPAAPAAAAHVVDPALPLRHEPGAGWGRVRAARSDAEGGPADAAAAPGGEPAP